MKLVATPYRWLWRTWWTNVKHWGWDIRTGLANIPLFFEAVWWFRSWDYSGLLHLMEIAATAMHRAHREDVYHQHADRYAKELATVALLCKRLRQDDYFEAAGYDAETWKAVPDARKSHIAKQSCVVAQEDANYLGKMFKHVQRWWT